MRARTLAQRWIALAGTLPVHDLIDRVFHEGDVVARTLAVAPQHLGASVQANLEALIELALSLDAGRFPSLPRFIHELAGARRGPLEEAPDEGVADAGDVVRLMTVHGAKGLEAPIVCLADAHSGPGKSNGLAPLIDWPAGADAPTHFSFLVSGNEAGAGRAELLQRERDADELEEKNLLYVAMTRAKQLLIVCGAEKRGAGDDSAYARVLAAVSSGEDPFHYVAPQIAGSAAAATTGARPFDPSLSGAAAAGVSAAGLSAPATGVRRAPPTAGMRHGVLVHALLQHLADARDTGRAASEVAVLAAQLAHPEPEVRNLLPQTAAVLAAPALARFFDPAQFVRACNEIEVVSGGALLRIDRLVEFDTEVWVLDYKAQVLDSERDAYRAQVAAYAAAVMPLYPGKTVKAGLIDLAQCALFSA